MKTNVSIKFNSVEEYREIEKKLVELGYESDKDWNEVRLMKPIAKYVYISKQYVFNIYGIRNEKTYNSLQEFLNDIKWNLQ